MLPEALRNGRLNPLSQKKRPAPMHNASSLGVEGARSMTSSVVQSPDSSSSIDDAHSKRASRTYNNPTVPHPPTSKLGSAYRQTPQQIFSPAPQNRLGFQQSSPPIGDVPSSTTQTIIPPLDASRSNGFSDLSTMMFPSNDPFAYPNQPMTMFESLHDSSQDQAFNLHMFNNGSEGESYNYLNAPFYGPLPSYAMPVSQGSPAAGMPQSVENSTALPAQGWSQQTSDGRFRGPTTGLNWGAMFGEDWSGGWTDQSDRQ